MAQHHAPLQIQLGVVGGDRQCLVAQLDDPGESGRFGGICRLGLQLLHLQAWKRDERSTGHVATTPQ